MVIDIIQPSFKILLHQFLLHQTLVHTKNILVLVDMVLKIPLRRLTTTNFIITKKNLIEEVIPHPYRLILQYTINLTSQVRRAMVAVMKYVSATLWNHIRKLKLKWKERKQPVIALHQIVK